MWIHTFREVTIFEGLRRFETGDGGRYGAGASEKGRREAKVGSRLSQPEWIREVEGISFWRIFTHPRRATAITPCCASSPPVHQLRSAPAGDFIMMCGVPETGGAFGVYIIELCNIKSCFVGPVLASMAMCPVRLFENAYLEWKRCEEGHWLRRSYLQGACVGNGVIVLKLQPRSAGVCAGGS